MYQVDRVCGGATPTAEHTQALVYVTQCMKEALRIYPPIVLASRQLTEDLHVDGVTVPKGVRSESAYFNSVDVFVLNLDSWTRVTVCCFASSSSV